MNLLTSLMRPSRRSLLAERKRLQAQVDDLGVQWRSLHTENVALHATLLVKKRQHLADLEVLAMHTVTIQQLSQVVEHAQQAGHDPGGVHMIKHILHHHHDDGGGGRAGGTG